MLKNVPAQSKPESDSEIEAARKAVIARWKNPEFVTAWKAMDNRMIAKYGFEAFCESDLPITAKKRLTKSCP